ncbi:MAG: winged helix-turn-helix transcriptional regulator [Alphaproteobacteria bacterium]|nr:winged helix-turn-helix transcriptional regulator [Alphaproteobacteria bacterium]
MKITPEHMSETAHEVGELLKAIANPHRLVMLCQMVEGEKSVGQLAEFTGIRDSTASQNLSLMRKMGLVEARRDGQTMWYSIKSPEAHAILETLYRLYCADRPLCAPEGPPKPKKRRKT